MEKVTFFWSKYYYARITLDLSDKVHELLRQKAAEYEVTPQQIVDDACASLTSVSGFDCEKIIETYVRAL